MVLDRGVGAAPLTAGSTRKTGAETDDSNMALRLIESDSGRLSGMGDSKRDMHD